MDEAIVSPSQTSEASPRHVLVVDDDALTLKLTVARLKAAGYRVTAVRSAAEALAQSVQEPPDVIFSDVLMGETDGFGFCRRVRGTPAIAHVPVVLASAHYWDEKAHALAESVGASTLVGRSPDFDVELKALDDAVRRGQAPRARAIADVYEEHLRTNADQISRLLDEAREAEGRYRALFENANEAIAVMNASGVILEANERWRYILGAEPRSLVGRHLLDFTRHGRETFRPELDAAIERGTGRVYGVPVARADDATVYVDFSISVVKVGDRRLIFAIGRDVTGRFLAAQALALAEEKYRSLVERLPDVVMTTSGDRWLFVTNNVEQITGFTPAEVFAMDRRAWLARVHPDDEQRFDSAVESYLEHGTARPLNVEYRFRHKDGRFIWFWHRVTATYERNGVSHSDSLVSDVTERKKLEESLRQAQKMEAIGQLTGGIAHDFNNILATILANSEFLLSELGLNDPRATEVGEIKLAAERAALLTRQLLAFSRKQVLELRATDLNRLLSHTERMLRRLIGEDIELSVILDAELGTTLADSGQIEQVLLNLVVNARDAMPRGGVLQIQTSNVSVEVGDDDRHGVLKPGKYVMIAVSDSGVGMDRETQGRIFEPFFTTKEAGRGTGLGLATCHGIVSQLGGQIVVYSELGLGTVFKVYLPVAEGSVPARESAPSVAPPANGETVLLVEDDLSLRSAIERMLASRGYRVLVAKDAEDALELAERHRGEVSVILTDVVMPRMSGPELVERARASTGEVKALFMSGYTDHALLRGGLVTQRFHFIQKPFTLHALSTKLQEVLS